MIEMLEGFPDNVVTAAAKGQVTRQDYERDLIPRVNAALARFNKIRCYYEIGHDFLGFDAGAMWDDAKIGFEHLSRWERVAVVTDIEWIKTAMRFFGFLIPGQYRCFSTAQAAEARKWIAA